tara:strand:+ start:1237 stop:1383 length:147 start_codon:yes stop_codon:yes gene_type:complete
MYIRKFENSLKKDIAGIIFFSKIYSPLATMNLPISFLKTEKNIHSFKY